MVSKNNNVNKNKNVININIDSKKKRKRTTKRIKKRGNNEGATLSYPSSTTTNNYITSMTYPGNHTEAPAPVRINRNQILNQHTLSGNEILEQEHKELKEQTYTTQKEKMRRNRVAHFDQAEVATPTINKVETYAGKFSLFGDSDETSHDALLSKIIPKETHIDDTDLKEETPRHYYPTNNAIDYDMAVMNTGSARARRVDNGTKTFTKPKVPILQIPVKNENAQNDIVEDSINQEDIITTPRLLELVKKQRAEPINIKHDSIGQFNGISTEIVDYQHHLHKPFEPVNEEQGVETFDSYLPSNINNYENKGILSGDNKAIINSDVDHSTHHRDNPNMGSDVLPNEKYSGDLIENVVSAPDTFHNILQTPILTLEEQLLESKAKKDKLHAEDKQI